MAATPENELQWNTLRSQAQAMHPSHGKLGQLSPAAAKWLRDSYTNSGGSFVGSPSEVPKQFQDVWRRHDDAVKSKAKRKEQEGNLAGY